MVIYSSGKIYKIEPTCEHDEGDIYIGSTCQQRLCTRYSAHKLSSNSCSSKLLFKKYGIENCNIVLIELVNATSKEELHMRESYFIKTLKCVNKSIPLRTVKEYAIDKHDMIYEKQKIYNETNRVKITELKKTYRETNNDKIKEYNKQYRLKKKNIFNWTEIHYQHKNLSKRWIL
jgi:hypothetical protein